MNAQTCKNDCQEESVIATMNCAPTKCPIDRKEIHEPALQTKSTLRAERPKPNKCCLPMTLLGNQPPQRNIPEPHRVHSLGLCFALFLVGASPCSGSATCQIQSLPLAEKSLYQGTSRTAAHDTDLVRWTGFRTTILITSATSICLILKVKSRTETTIPPLPRLHEPRLQDPPTAKSFLVLITVAPRLSIVMRDYRNTSDPILASDLSRVTRITATKLFYARAT